MADNASSSSATLLQSRLANWESTLKDVSNSGYASSEESLDTHHVEIYVDDGLLKYREHDGHSFRITNLRNIPGKTMHFRRARVARFAGANALETARIEALTRAIFSGIVRITGSYACVNHIGTYPDDSAPELRADTPVPIKIQHGQTVPAIIQAHEVIVAKKVRKKIYACHIKPEYSPSDNVRQLSSQRIYFAGVKPEQSEHLRELAAEHYSARVSGVHLDSPNELKTERVAVTVFGLTNGKIMTILSDYLDRVHLKYIHGEFHTIGTVNPIYSEHGEQPKIPVILEHDCNGRRATIFSAEPVKVRWRYDTTMWLSAWEFTVDRRMRGDMMQKAARQFKNLTLESYAKMIGATLLDVVAAFQRTSMPVERSVWGHTCYLFGPGGRPAKDCLRAEPMRRDELEGLAVIATPDGDYSVRTSEKVMYTRAENGVWHMDADGDTASVPGPDLVGADMHGELVD